jgi:HSP20 family protein
MALMRYTPTMPWRPSQQSWSPMEGLGSLRAEVDRLFDTFFGNVPSAGAGDSPWSPQVDVLEHDQGFVLVADLPGMKQEDIDISVQNNLLTLRGKRLVEYATQNGQNGHGFQYTERASGTFCRRFPLGAAVDADHITGTYKAGVLEVHLPKTAAVQPKRIAIHAAS